MLKFLTGFRKFVITVFYILVSIVLLVLGIIPAEGWLEQITTGIVAFMGTNIGEHLLSVAKSYVEKKDDK